MSRYHILDTPLFLRLLGKPRYRYKEDEKWNYLDAVPSNFNIKPVEGKNALSLELKDIPSHMIGKDH